MDTLEKYKICLNGDNIKVVLINPSNSGISSQHMYRYPPLGILYLASYILKNIPNVQVQVIDGSVAGNLKDVQKKISVSDADVFGISISTDSKKNAYKIIGDIKSSHDVPIVVGGSHPSVIPEEPLHFGADISVIGEGEVTFTEIINSFQKNATYDNIRGICFKKNEKILKTGPRFLIENLDDIPFPARNLINLSKYSGFPLKKEKKETTILSSRGCPNDCVFCANAVWKISKPRVRVRSPKNIISELRMLREEHDINEFFDYADEFNCIPSWSLKLCKALKNEQFSWKCMCIPNNLNEELAKAMSEAGCWLVLLGIESANDKTLKGIRKPITKESVRKTCVNLKKYGISVMGSFMLFNVWEDNDKLEFEDVQISENTINFARELIKDNLIDYCTFQFTTPRPGSKLYEIAKKHNILPENYDHFNSLFSMSLLLPIEKGDIGRVKMKADLLMASCALRKGNVNIEHTPYFLKRICNSIVDTLL